jgi:hypothetical protein
LIRAGRGFGSADAGASTSIGGLDRLAVAGHDPPSTAMGRIDLFGSKRPKTIKTEDGEAVLGWTLDQPLLSQLGPDIQVVADRLAALSLPELGAEALTNTFTPEYQVTNAQTWSLVEITEHFMPPHCEPKFNEPDEATGAECQVHELIAEAVQLLEHAGLLMHRNYYYIHNYMRDYSSGYAPTRLGRTALADGSVERRLAAAMPAAPLAEG